MKSFIKINEVGDFKKIIDFFESLGIKNHNGYEAEDRIHHYTKIHTSAYKLGIVLVFKNNKYFWYGKSCFLGGKEIYTQFDSFEHFLDSNRVPIVSR